MKYNKSNIMKRAHEIRKATNPRITMSDALRASWKQAKWAALKEDKKEDKKMKGSEKQIKWANDIIASARTAFQSGKKLAAAQFPGELHIWETAERKYEEAIAQVESASVIINNRKSLDGQAVASKVQRLANMQSRGVDISNMI